MNLTATFNPISIANLVVIGVLSGILTVIIVMSLVVSIFTKLPGRGCTRYWAAGLVLLFFGGAIFMSQPHHVATLTGMLAFGIMLAGFILQWQGLRIFHLKAPSAHWREIAAVFMVLYGLFLANDFSYGSRRALLGLFCIVMTSLCVIDIIQYNHLRFTRLNWAAVGGCVLMMMASLIVMLEGLFATGDTGMPTMSIRGMLLHIIIPVVGLIVYSCSLVCLYFYRIAESTNYAASHDELTGLLNRRAVIQYGRREVEVALRARQPLTVAFIDIDFFKKINDQYGHDTGDVVLREVAKLLSLTCRSVDLVGRYGGEEFCVVFAGRGDSDGGAEGLGERLVDAVRDHSFSGVPQVTISVGLAVLPAGATSASWYNLVHLADTELYKAKNAGRNRYSVVFVDDVDRVSQASAAVKLPAHAGEDGPFSVHSR